MAVDEIEDFNKMFDTIDTDHSGKISYSEFITMSMDRKNMMTRENLKVTFKSLDLDDNGFLSIEELKRAF
jgi:calcium-dependent protein kinase